MLLRLVGIGFILYLFANNAAGKISDKIKWNFRPVDWKTFAVRIVNGKLVAVFQLRIEVTNNLSIPITVQRFLASVSWRGLPIANLNSTAFVELPPNQSKQLGIEVMVSDDNIIDQLKPGNLLSPIQIDGSIHFSNNVVLPISQTVQFIAVG